MVDITKENFPLHDLLVAENSSITDLQAEFEAAAAGDDAEAIYDYVLGVQTVARHVPADEINGCTEKIMEKTLQSSRAVFKNLAEGGHKNAAIVYEEYRVMKVGL